MRMRGWAVAAGALAAALFGSGRAAAQPEPTIEVRLRSVNDLLDRGEYIGSLVGKEEEVKQVRGLVKQLSAGGKGIEGIDPKRPFGVYATLTQDVAASPVVVMIPVADEERVLAALKDRLMIVPEKVEGGALKANVPILNAVYMRFADGYLYLAREAKDLDPKGLASPKSYFGKDDGSVLSVVARVDRVPAELKTFVIGQLELGVQQELKNNPGNNPGEKKMKALVFDSLVGGAKSLADDSKEVALRVFVDPKTDELSAEATLTPKTGTPLAKTVSGLAGKTSLPAGIVAAKDPVLRLSGKIEVPADARKRFASAIDDLFAELAKQANPNEQEFAKRVLDTIAPTVKSGEFDGAATLSGPDAKGKYTLLAAVAVKNGKEVEKLLKDVAPHIPADAVEITFDVEKAGKFSLHKVVVKADDPQLERVFGTRNVWLATSDDCIALSVEPEGAALKAGLKAKPATVPVLTAELALAKALPVFEPRLKPDELKALVKDAFGGEPAAGKDTVSLSVEGGEKLTFKVKVKGKAIRLGSSLDLLKR